MTGNQYSNTPTLHYSLGEVGYRGAYFVISGRALSAEYVTDQIPLGPAYCTIAGSQTPDGQKIHSGGGFFAIAAGKLNLIESPPVSGKSAIGAGSSSLV